MKQLLIGVLLLISANAYSQKLDCKKFRDGKFILVDSVLGNSYIERKGSAQIEYGDSSKLKLKLKVKWIDDCTYTLTLVKVLENPDHIIVTKNMVLTSRITETKPNSYVQETSSNVFDFVIMKEITRIE